MSGLSEADGYLIGQIQAGDQQGWSQLVDRFQGRLTAFAGARLSSFADAEDAVQETFISFLKSIPSFRKQCSIETYLFTIIRRKIIDAYRRKGCKNFCLIQDVYTSDENAVSPLDNYIADDPSVSFYARKDEQVERIAPVLENALLDLLAGYKKNTLFNELKIIELLFYCHLSNSDIAKITSTDASAIAVIKHRALKNIKSKLQSTAFNDSHDDAVFENMLTSVWQNSRLSCPKRSTIGSYLLETLDEGWNDYVDFHLNRIGCHFCMANLKDLKDQDQKSSVKSLHTKIFQSTVGFLRKA